jgi:hypothetical protein
MSQLGYNLDFDIINTHIVNVLDQDSKYIDAERKKYQNAVSTDVSLVLTSLAFNLFERCYEQSKTIHKLLEEIPHIDLASITSCLRSLFENFIDYIYLFHCPILKEELSAEGRFKASIESCKLKCIIHEMYGVALLLAFKNSNFSDLPTIISRYRDNHFESDFVDKLEYIKNFNDELFLEKGQVRTIQSKLRSNFKTIKKNLLSSDFNKLSKNTNKHKLLERREILAVNGYVEELNDFYSYLSDHTHVGKMALLERSMGLYEKSDSLTLKFLNQFCLFLITQFYLIYVDFRKQTFGKGFGMQSEYFHEASGTTVSTIKIFHYWINLYRQEEIKREHFVEEKN